MSEASSGGWNPELYNIAIPRRIDLKMAELEKELKAAEKIPAVTGYDEELKNFQSFLSTVKSFMNDMQKARSKGAYSDKEYQAMSEAYEYGLSVI